MDSSNTSISFCV